MAVQVINYAIYNAVYIIQKTQNPICVTKKKGNGRKNERKGKERKHDLLELALQIQAYRIHTCIA